MLYLFFQFTPIHNMRTILLAAFSLFFLLPAMGQEKCHYEIDKVDKFTDDVMMLTRAEKIWRGFYEEEFIECAAVRKNDQRGLLMAYYAHEEYRVEESDSLMLLLENEEIVVLKAAKERLAERFSDKIYFANVFYPVDDKSMELLMGHSVEAVRQYYKGGFFERNLKEKKQGAVKGMLGCVQ